MKALALLFCAAWPAVAGDFTFTDRVVSFTNLQGRAFDHVTLVKADREGVIWRNDSSGGRVAYTNLSPAVLEDLGLPTNLIPAAEAAGPARLSPQSAVSPPRKWSGRPTRWQEIRLTDIQSNSPSCYKCKAVPFTPGGTPVPEFILIEHLPADLASIPDQIAAEEAAMNRLVGKLPGYASALGNQVKTAVAPNPASPAGVNEDPLYGNAAEDARIRRNLQQSGAGETVERLGLMKAEYDAHRATIGHLQQRLSDAKLKLFFTGYLVNGLEVWEGGRR